MVVVVVVVVVVVGKIELIYLSCWLWQHYCFMGRGVDMRFSDPRGFGIKKRSWFGGRSRPAFMEPLVGGPLGVPLGVPPPCDG